MPAVLRDGIRSARRPNEGRMDRNDRQDRRLNRQRGSGSLKAIVCTAILVALVYVGIKVLPILVTEYEFQDSIQNIARYASVNRQDETKIQKAVVAEAQKDGLPIMPEDVKVEGAGGNVQISADYSVTVDLSVYQWTLNFHPTAVNKALF
jgi:hypothetical protein